MTQPFRDPGSKILTPEAFQFALESELKRAVRLQSYLTLVMLEAQREWEGLMVTADDGTVNEVAEVIGREVRDTDLIGLAENGTLAVLFLDTNFDYSTAVIERLAPRIESYDFRSSLRISVSAACYPTHAVDAPSLKRQALSHPIVNWRSGIRSSAEHN
jgi:hypothetical protein